MDYSGSNFAIVNFESASDATPSGGNRWEHSYFRDAPTESSDVALMLRDDLDPGPPGRPREHIGRKFWRFPPGYPAVEMAAGEEIFKVSDYHDFDQ